MNFKVNFLLLSLLVNFNIFCAREEKDNNYIAIELRDLDANYNFPITPRDLVNARSNTVPNQSIDSYNWEEIKNSVKNKAKEARRTNNSFKLLEAIQEANVIRYYFKDRQDMKTLQVAAAGVFATLAGIVFLLAHMATR